MLMAGSLACGPRPVNSPRRSVDRVPFGKLKARGRAMTEVQEERDRSLIARIREAGQGHVLAFLEELSPGERRALLDQLARIDLGELARLDRLRGEASRPVPPPGPLQPPP